MGLFSGGLGFRMLPWFSPDMELSDTLPTSEGVVPAAGSGAKVSRDDHAHMRLTSSHSGLTLDASGVAQIIFTRTFANEPAINITPFMAAGATQPQVIVPTSYVMSNGLYTGVNVKGFQAQAVAVSILGVNVNAFGGNPAGAKFTLVALQVS